MQAFKQLFYTSRWPIVLAIGAIVGSLLYYLIPYEPTLSDWPWGVAALVISALLLRVKPLVGAAVLLALGYFIHAAVFTHHLALDKGQDELSDNAYWVQGQIKYIEDKPKKRARLYLQPVIIYQAGDIKLQQVRVSVAHSRIAGFNTGDWISLQAKLDMPREPGFPNDYDARFYQYFNKLDASGYVYGKLYASSRPVHVAEKPYTWFTKLTAWRQKLAPKINTYDASGVGAALLTGIRGEIKEDTRNDYQRTGIAHILAISGLHLSTVGGFVFFALRYLVALSPALSSRVNGKKCAALAGILVSFGYMLLAGATVSTVRAFIMLTLLFTAVLMERYRSALRIIAIAVLVVLLFWPYSVVTASFQLSFMATLFLILWAYSAQEDKHNKTRIGYIKGVLHTSIVAGLATMPLGALHFQLISLSGFLINLVAVPVLAFYVLPVGFIMLPLLILGIEKPFMFVYVAGIDTLNAVAAWGDSWPLAWAFSPAWFWPIVTILCGTCLWFYLGHKYVKSAIVFTLLMLCLLGATQLKPFSLFVLDEGQSIGYLTSPHSYILLKEPTDYNAKFTLKRFDHTYGLHLNADKAITPSCDSMGCVYSVDGTKILIATTTPEWEVDCAEADIILYPQEKRNSLFPPHTCTAVAYNHARSVFIKKKGATFLTETYSPKANRVWQ